MAFHSTKLDRAQGVFGPHGCDKRSSEVSRKNGSKRFLNMLRSTFRLRSDCIQSLESTSSLTTLLASYEKVQDEGSDVFEPVLIS